VVQEWLAHPATKALRSRLAYEAAVTSNIAQLKTDGVTLEQIGLEAAARKFTVGGLLTAFDIEDPGVYLEWLKEAKE
jgi:hypothetical protein